MRARDSGYYIYIYILWCRLASSRWSLCLGMLYLVKYFVMPCVVHSNDDLKKHAVIQKVKHVSPLFWQKCQRLTADRPTGYEVVLKSCVCSSIDFIIYKFLFYSVLLTIKTPSIWSKYKVQVLGDKSINWSHLN